MWIQKGETMKILLCIIATEAITQLICKAEIFDTIREKIKNLSKFTNDLLSCPYCVSVWSGMFLVFLYWQWEYTELFVLLLVLHRCSNVLHDIYKVIVNFKIDQILKRL